MSVLVKGMEMPKCCSMCNFKNQWGYCLAYGCGTERCCPYHDKPDWCPLIEVPTPHGRLIDAKALWDESDKYEWYCRDEELSRAFGLIADAPTVIEAEADHE